MHTEQDPGPLRAWAGVIVVQKGQGPEVTAARALQLPQGPCAFIALQVLQPPTGGMESWMEGWVIGLQIAQPLMGQSRAKTALAAISQMIRGVKFCWVGAGISMFGDLQGLIVQWVQWVGSVRDRVFWLFGD